jgi:DNA invertase Pin-like site-specific DNA recombinase
MLVGYARISTDEQNNKLQIDALNAAGCERIYPDQDSGGVRERPELNKMLDQLRKGDVVVCWKVDRLSRSLRDLLDIMAKIEAAEAGFKSLTEAIDTTTPAGRMMLHMLGAVAEFEKSMIRARTKAGLEAARKAGKLRGRGYKLKPDVQAKVIRDIKAGRETMRSCAEYFHVNVSTIWRLMERHKAVGGTVSA